MFTVQTVMSAMVIVVVLLTCRFSFEQKREQQEGRFDCFGSSDYRAWKGVLQIYSYDHSISVEVFQ